MSGIHRRVACALIAHAEGWFARAGDGGLRRWPDLMLACSAGAWGLVAAEEPAPADLEEALALAHDGLAFATLPPGSPCEARLSQAGFEPMAPNLLFVVDPATVEPPTAFDVREAEEGAFLEAYGAAFDLGPSGWTQVGHEVSAPECVRLLAYVDGEVAGCAAFGAYDGAAYLTYGGTLSAFRRRGVHRALTAARLARAVARGYDLAFVFSGEENPTQHTFRALGFREAEPFASWWRRA